MVDESRFERVILTNTIVAAFCVVLLITIIVFIIVFLLPLFRRQWSTNPKKEDQGNPFADILSLTRQSSLQNFPFVSSRLNLNPIFESGLDTTQTTTTTNQFGQLFHPQASIATLIHPTIWTPITPPSVISSSASSHRPPSPSPSTPTISTKSSIPPPLPTQPPMTTKSITPPTLPRLGKNR